MQTIYIYLLDEGIDVWRPVQAEQISADTYKIVSTNESQGDEHWEFETGSVVRCHLKNLSGGEKLVAYEAA